jgi:lysophospholipase L1-like esterase
MPYLPRCLTVFALLVFGAITGAVAAEPGRWEAEIKKFEAQDRDQPPPVGGIVFVGSSSIRLWDLAKSFPGRPTINRGFGGSELADSVQYADRLVIKHKPRTVVLYAGDNDIAHGKAAEDVARDFGEFVKAVQAGVPGVKIVYIAIKPSLARWKLADEIKQANQLIAKACQADENLAFVDVWGPMLGEDGRPKKELFRADGLHLSEAGYKLWAKLVEPHLGEAAAKKK